MPIIAAILTPTFLGTIICEPSLEHIADVPCIAGSMCDRSPRSQNLHHPDNCNTGPRAQPRRSAITYVGGFRPVRSKAGPSNSRAQRVLACLHEHMFNGRRGRQSMPSSQCCSFCVNRAGCPSAVSPGKPHYHRQQSSTKSD